VIALELGVPPAAVWEMDARDMATLVDVLTERADEAKKASRRRR
jgi:hypothetical protein